MRERFAAGPRHKELTALIDDPGTSGASRLEALNELASYSPLKLYARNASEMLDPDMLPELVKTFGLRAIGDGNQVLATIEVEHTRAKCRTNAGEDAGSASLPLAPITPMREYCLVPPTGLRWAGTRDVEQRLWHLLGAAG